MIEIRKATAADMPIVTELAELIWPQTYSEYISEAQLRYMLNLMYNQEELLLQYHKGFTFFIASVQGKDVGFACASPLDEQNHVYKLHKLYVLPSTQGMGIGKLLIDKVVDLVAAEGGKFLQLNVNRKNKAINFYLKIGFIIKKTVDINIGDGFYMNDYVMELPIS
jgi:ribosomal protein S18 acetylase RimI-like enzyme